MCEQGAQRYANANVDRQVGPRNMIVQECYGPTPSTDDKNTYKYI